MDRGTLRSESPISKSEPFDLAADFCNLVDVPDLLAYLELPPTATGPEAIAALKEERKRMQGMQNNPKYKKQALFLIKHLQALQEALSDLEAYRKDLAARALAKNLPVLEVAIRGVLAGGNLSSEQEEFLRKNARELGVADTAFEEALARLCKEAGVARGDHEETLLDYYNVLGVSPESTLDAIEKAYRLHRSATPAAEKRSELDKAFEVLGDSDRRGKFDALRHRYGLARPLPVSALSGGNLAAPYQLPEAPQPKAKSRLEVLGDPLHRLETGRQKVNLEILVRNGGNAPMPGRVWTDQPWITAEPSSLDGLAKEQTIFLEVDPGKMPGKKHLRGVVTFQTDQGERAQVILEVEQVRSTALLVAGVFLAGVLLLGAGIGITLVLAMLWTGIAVRGPSGAVSATLTVRVDPGSESVLLDGLPIGKGAVVTLADPPPGPATLTVVQSGFETLTQDIVVDPPADRPQEVSVVLKPQRALDFRPTEELVRGEIPREEIGRVVNPRYLELDKCLRLGRAGAEPIRGTVYVYVDRDGIPSGVEVKGDAAAAPETTACLGRQVTLLHFSPLARGDFATLRYDYDVRPAPEQP